MEVRARVKIQRPSLLLTAARAVVFVVVTIVTAISVAALSIWLFALSGN